jgi:hypothetical protein
MWKLQVEYGNPNFDIDPTEENLRFVCFTVTRRFVQNATALQIGYPCVYDTREFGDFVLISW